MSTETRPPQFLTRVILPVVLVAAIIAAITWVSLNSSRKVDDPVKKATPTSGPNEFSSKPSALKFLRPKSNAGVKAVWDLERPDYAREFEMGVEGYYDFPFVNPTDKPVMLGFEKTSCDCSQVKGAVLPESASKVEELADVKKNLLYPTDEKTTWTLLPVSTQEKDALEVPPGGAGVARVYWNGRKSAGSSLNINIRMWMHPKGKPEESSSESLMVPILMAPSLQFTTQKLSLGSVGTGGSASGHFFAWSPTRESIDIKLDPERKDPLLDVSITRLDAAGIAELEKELLKEKHNTRVLSAYRIDVTAHEQKGGQQLEQGPFARGLPLVLDETVFDLSQLPTVGGIVRGDIEVGAVEDAGKINLKTFSSKVGTRRTLPVWSEGSGELKVEQVTPSTLKVSLRKVEKESTPARSRWTLDLEIPPGAWRGTGPPDAMIVLQSTMPARRIRIPIFGNAGQ